MGASLVYLNEPNKEIEHEKGGNHYLSYAAGSMQGWRLNMVRKSKSILLIYQKQILAELQKMFGLKDLHLFWKHR